MSWRCDDTWHGQSTVTISQEAVDVEKGDCQTRKIRIINSSTFTIWDTAADAFSRMHCKDVVCLIRNAFDKWMIAKRKLAACRTMYEVNELWPRWYLRMACLRLSSSLQIDRLQILSVWAIIKFAWIRKCDEMKMSMQPPRSFGKEGCYLRRLVLHSKCQYRTARCRFNLRIIELRSEWLCMLNQSSTRKVQPESLRTIRQCAGIASAAEHFIIANTRPAALAILLRSWWHILPMAIVSHFSERQHSNLQLPALLPTRKCLYHTSGNTRQVDTKLADADRVSKQLLRDHRSNAWS